MVIDYKPVKFADAFTELLPLFEAHYKEIAYYKDIPLRPDYDAYIKADEAGVLKTFIALRTDLVQPSIVGYAIYTVATNRHYRTSLNAHQDVLFIHPEHRGFGERFVQWCDEELKREGVQVVTHHVKTYFNFGPMLERNGYELIEHIYSKRLDR